MLYWMDICMCLWIDGWMDVCMMDGCTYGCMYGWMDGWMDVCIDSDFLYQNKLLNNVKYSIIQLNPI